MTIANIPIKPEVSLENYLLSLNDRGDKKRSDIYLTGADKWVRKIWNEVIKRGFRSLRVTSFIPKNLGVHSMMLYSYKSGKKAIPVSTLYRLLILQKQICNKSDAELNKSWQAIFLDSIKFSGNRGPKINLPKVINPRLSYLLGWICGDGHLANYGNHYLIKISEKSTEQLKFINFLVYKLFGVWGKVHRMYKNGYALLINSKPLLRFLKNVLEIKVGEIPKIIQKVNNTNIRFFISGLFDSEGSVSKTRNIITISQTKHDFLTKLQELALRVGVKFNGPTKHETKLGIWYSIRIEKKTEVLNFAKKIGSFHVEKSKLLNNLINRISQS